MEDVVGVEDKDCYCLLDSGVLDHHSQMHATIFGELHGSLSSVFVRVGTKQDHWKFHIFQGRHGCQEIESLEDEANMLQSETWQELVGRVFVNLVAHDV